MNETLLNQYFLEFIYHQTTYDELLRKSRDGLLIQSLENHRNTFWDKALFSTGNILISLGEKLQRNRGSLRLSQGCQ